MYTILCQRDTPFETLKKINENKYDRKYVKMTGQYKKETVVISFRIPKDKSNVLNEIIKENKLKKSEYLKSIFLKKSSNVVITPNITNSPNYMEMLRIVSKASNNLNQIAKYINKKNLFNIKVDVKEIYDKLENIEILLNYILNIK